MPCRKDQNTFSNESFLASKEICSFTTKIKKINAIMFDTKMKAYLLFYFLVINDSSKVLLLSSFIGGGTTLIFISEKIVIFIFSGSYGVGRRGQ